MAEAALYRSVRPIDRPWNERTRPGTILAAAEAGSVLEVTVVAPTPSADESSVSSIELFFDLVFVFTLTQLTALLANDLSPEGALRVVLIFIVLFWMYGAYAWATNHVPPDRPARQALLVSGMGAFLLCALAIPRAFDGTGVIFGVGYLLVVAVHTTLYSQVLGREILRFAPVNVVSALVLIVAGLTDGVVAYALWVGVVVMHTVPPWMVGRGSAGSRLSDVRATHFVERHGLLLIVAFGESVIAIGVAIDPAQLDAGVISVAGLALALAAGSWWVYFAHDAAGAERRLASASPDELFRITLGGYFYAFVPMLLGVIATSAGIKASLGRIAEPLVGRAAIALAGGVALYLLGQAAFRSVLRLGPAGSRLVAALAAMASAIMGVHFSAAAQLTGLVLVLAALIVFEFERAKRPGSPVESADAA
jgi:low temperature requirement protein LtrA